MSGFVQNCLFKNYLLAVNKILGGFWFQPRKKSDIYTFLMPPCRWKPVPGAIRVFTVVHPSVCPILVRGNISQTQIWYIFDLTLSSLGLEDECIFCISTTLFLAQWKFVGGICSTTTISVYEIMCVRVCVFTIYSFTCSYHVYGCIYWFPALWRCGNSSWLERWHPPLSLCCSWGLTSSGVDTLCAHRPSLTTGTECHVPCWAMSMAKVIEALWAW